MKPVFSVITVTYNAERWLENTIISIIGQTYDQMEYIIIDGKSTDKTVEIIKEYTSHLSFWISEPDLGLYDAMNKGLQKATGDYVWFINAGDTIYANDTVQKMVNLIGKESSLPDILYGETAIVNEKEEFVGMRRLKAPEKLEWKSFKMGMLVSHQSFIAKRNIAPYYDTEYKFSSDFDWCIRCMKRAQFILNTHDILSCYMDEGMTTANRKASLKERYRIMSKYYGSLPSALRHVWFAIRFYTSKLINGKV